MISHKDHAPLVRSLLQHLSNAGIHPTTTFDGEEHISSTTADEVVEAASDVDAASIVCIWQDGQQQPHSCTLQLVFGNDPDELVADYRWNPHNEAILEPLEEALDAYAAEWTGKNYPRRALCNVRFTYERGGRVGGSGRPGDDPDEINRVFWMILEDERITEFTVAKIYKSASTSAE